jgi:hypothetical protein
MSRRRLTARLVAVLAAHLTAASVLMLAIANAAQAIALDWVTSEWATVGDLIEMGNYTGLANPNGTLRKGGNVEEWTETITDWKEAGDLGAYGGHVYTLKGRISCSEKH